MIHKWHGINRTQPNLNWYFYLFIAVEIRSQLATSLAYKIISASITAMWAFWNEQNNNNTNKFV